MIAKKRSMAILFERILLHPLLSEKLPHIRRNLDDMGKTVAMADCLIAGICIEHGMSLLSRNRKHFERIPNLTQV